MGMGRVLSFRRRRRRRNPDWRSAAPRAKPRASPTAAAWPGARGRRRRLPRAAPFWLVLLPLLGLLAFQMKWGTETGTVSGPVFTLCGVPPHRDCVIDGDTFYLDRQPIRIADIDTPETHPPRCPAEARLGERATHRLVDLLNAGPFTLEAWGRRNADRYGRRLRIVVRDGRSLGAVLVAEGLARPWTGRRLPWCE